MDPRVALLTEFCRELVPDKVKIEAEHFGFDFLEQLLSEGGTLDYGELTDTRMVHRYKLVGVSELRMVQFLQLHVLKQLNVCRYFGTERNDVFCYNIDNNRKLDNTTLIPQVIVARDTLRECLIDLGCKPLILASGRGYHVWLRLNEAVENARLHEFMIATAARALLPLVARGDDHRIVKFSFYPDINAIDGVSLRVFGSEHCKSKVFSHVFTPEGLLDEEASWAHFEDFMRNKTTPTATIERALTKLAIA